MLSLVLAGILVALGSARERETDGEVEAERKVQATELAGTLVQVKKDEYNNSMNFHGISVELPYAHS
jgi:hypothetical protein